jgi:2-polyprenyl-3-methyl-5-hydroxy-6-metoxy-1,4-benzoquinol methylase
MPHLSPSLTLSACSVCGSMNISSVEKTTSMMHDGSGVYNFDQCADCELVFLNPRVPLTVLEGYYTQYYLPYRGAEAWGKYASFVEKDQRDTDEKRAEVLAKHCSADAQSVLLDLGCGKPTFLQVCQEKFKCKAHGIDFSDEGWSGSAASYGKLDLSIGDVHSISEDLKPDIISMWHYLEHDYNPKETLEKLANLVKASSKLVIEIPNFSSESRKKYGKEWAGYHTPRHTHLFSPSNIEILLNETGWKITHLDEKGTLDPYNLYWMSEMERENINWNKNMDSEFWGYVRGKVRFNVKRFFGMSKSHGVMTLVAEKG